MNPLAEYQARREARWARAARLARVDGAIAWSRLAVFVSAGLFAWLAFKSDAISGWWLLAPGLVFVALLVAHDRVIDARQRTERAAKLYEDGIARIEDRPPPTDGRSSRFSDERHVYAEDLDLFGKGSLFERLSTARTSMGEETFAAWLKAPAGPAVVRRRQQAVAELAPRLDLKEDLAVLGMDLRAEVNPITLASWASAPHQPLPTAPLGLAGARLVSALLGLVITAAGIAWLGGRAGLLPFVSAGLLGVGWTIRLRGIVGPVVASADRRASELKLLAVLLARFERERFETPLLTDLRRALDTADSDQGRALPPSRRIAQLARLVVMLESRRNQVFFILTAPLLWTTQLALAVEAWRRRFGPSVGAWLSAVGELEALGSLATFSYEHPELPFPTVVDGERGPVFDGAGLAHPLLPAKARVPNDLALGGGRPRLVVVSGSNMSGKSTLLRTVGVNAVLALAGGPVCATRLTLSPLAIGATLRIHDSLQEGRSRFYAEITRLREIVSLSGDGDPERVPKPPRDGLRSAEPSSVHATAGPLPVLFLLDELLSGTNSHDRRIGAEAVLRTLLDRNGMGLATTHDLALAEMAAGLGPAALNVHFADELRDGEMFFDYRMRPGVVKKSNAIALMRAIGLDVSSSD